MYTIAGFQVNDAQTIDQHVNQLKKYFIIRGGEERQETWKLSDTFDWRLYNRNLILKRIHHHLALVSLDNSKFDIRQSIQKDIRYVWDLPDGKLKQQLWSILEERALLDIVVDDVRVKTIVVLNELGKTVTRLSIHRFQPKMNITALPESYILVHALQGYKDESDQIVDQLKTQGLHQLTSSLYAYRLRNSDREPGLYSTKVNVSLSDDLPSVEAMRRIFQFLLQIMKENKQGIIEDIDTEFLHDFRVSLRRTRAGLSQVKGLYNDPLTRHFKDQLKKLQQLSNRLRDLDVYLLSKKEFARMLVPDLRPYIDHLFGRLTAEREAEYQRVMHLLQSDEYQNILTTWEQFVNKEYTVEELGINAGKPCKTLAMERIYKSYRKIIKMGKRITDDTPDADIHQLRIDCKKLRYLMEFFYSLFPQKEMNALSKHVKKLQDYLGKYNDYSVQQTFLKKYLDEHHDRSKTSYYTAAIIGGLLEHLYHEQKTLRSAFHSIFRDFSDKSYQKQFNRLFKL
ncbi:MAG: CHAD domain-containing protein [Caldithrix sp.]|nr:CHAD domain-containing protein [Caldithrix sp.]